MLATLDALLRALRQAGLHIGITEVMRLQLVFERQLERLSGADNASAQRYFKALLRAVIVKSPEEQHTFERVCDAWLRQADQDVQRLTTPTPSADVLQSADAQAAPSRWYTRRAVGVLTSVALVLLAIG